MADKIVAEYTVKVDKALKDLDRLASKVDKVDKERKQTQAGFKTMSNDMVSSFKKVGAALGLAFGAQQIVSFGKEAVKLASQLEGVERAFKRIGGANSANLLQGLRTATRGTVSDLVLMQKAVQASNFKIPLENLASLFKFAQARARETGESVEYLTNSIVLGIGRKSPLILDNLGISAVELRTRLKGVGVEAANVGDIAQIIGDIAEEELAKMGDQADTTADKIAQLSTTMQNLKTEAGEALITLGTGLATTLGIIDEVDPQLRALNRHMNTLSRWTLEDLNDGTKDLSELYVEIADKLEKINALKREEESLGTSSNDRKRRKEIIELLQEEELRLDTLRDAYDSYQNSLEKVDEVEKEQIKNLAYYNNLIKQLQEDQKDANITRAEVRRLEDEINEAVRQRNLLLGREAEQNNNAAKAQEQANKAYEDGLALLQKFQEGAFSDAEFSINRTADLNKLQSTKTIKDAEERKEALQDIEIDRLTGLISLNEEYGRDTIELEQRLADIKAGINDEYYKTLDNLQKENAEKEIERRREQEELNRELLGATLSSWATFTDLAANLTEQQYQRQHMALESQLEQDQISREEFDRRKAQLAREQAKKQKEFAIVQAVINTAIGVTNAFATAPNIILGAVLAAVVAATGAAEIATISSQPLPSFEDGGWVDGKGLIHGRSHAQGGVMIEAEGNEYITSGKYSKPNADILEAINTGNWEKYKMENIITPAINQVLEGGFENMGASYMLNNNFNDKNLLRQGDRNRMSQRDGFIYLGDRIEKALKSKSNNRYA